ncbi:hypothetical protein HY637_01175 [Candidatus Woesearchaeota archaeon]|nr:hypothetical protein [Candidatus Woesearchaeota archaeon]
MNKKVTIAFVAIVSALLIAGAAAAQGMWRSKANAQNWQGMGMMNGNMMKGMMQHHEEMEKVMEEGTYTDLAKLREEYGFSIMPWVENEEDFQLAKKMHEKMEKYREENGPGAGHCPMMG